MDATAVAGATAGATSREPLVALGLGAVDALQDRRLTLGLGALGGRLLGDEAR